jgi:hypothetical protein
MRKLFATATVFSALAGLAFADAKSAASTSTTQIYAVTGNNGAFFTTPWVTVSSTQIQPPGGKDLLINLSAQTIVAYNSDITATSGSGGFTYSVMGNRLEVRILVDGVPAAPGVVSYDSQFRFMETFLANPIANCHEFDPSGFVACNFGQNFIADLLETTGVRSFNFIMRNVSPANHVITAQVRFGLQNFVFPGPPSGNSYVFAVIGPRTLTVEQLHLD